MPGMMGVRAGYSPPGYARQAIPPIRGYPARAWRRRSIFLFRDRTVTAVFAAACLSDDPVCQDKAASCSEGSLRQYA